MFSELATEHIQRPRNVGPLEDATHYGQSGSPGGGPYVCIWLVIEGGIVRQATYETHGCPSSVAASSVTCHLATGREVERIRSLAPDELRLILGGLPEGKAHFADMAIEALRQALDSPVEEQYRQGTHLNS